MNTFWTSKSSTPFSTKEQRRSLSNFYKEPKPIAIKSAKEFMNFKSTIPQSIVSPKKALKEKILLKEKLLWSQPKEFTLKKVKSEPTISKVPFLNQYAIKK